MKPSHCPGHLSQLTDIITKGKGREGPDKRQVFLFKGRESFSWHARGSEFRSQCPTGTDSSVWCVHSQEG